MAKKSLTALVALCALAGCTAFPAQAVTDVVSLALARCVAEAEATDEATLAKACKVSEDMMPILHELLASKKTGMARAARAGACAPGPSDAGRD